jgi:(2Fe-2S) ferredoxin
MPDAPQVRAPRSQFTRAEVHQLLCGDAAPFATRLATLRREQSDKPVIYVGAGTCGLGAGARATIDAIHKWTGEHGYDVELVEVGCIGLCSDEPLVDVQLPGRPRVSFRRVDKRKAPKLLDKVFSGEIPQDDVVCQFPAEGSESWLDVPLYSEHPFFAPQTRWVLENCGHLDPYSIDEYLARGGYRAAADVLRGKSPREVCDEVIDAGLRGRGGGGFPAGRKWKIALEQPAEQKYMICNADEGDPGAFMDRAVIEGDPHRLVEGMAHRRLRDRRDQELRLYPRGVSSRHRAAAPRDRSGPRARSAR